MRYRLRTLLILMLLGGPLGAAAWNVWTSPGWQEYRRTSAAVKTRMAEWKLAKRRGNASRQAQAGRRHAELRFKREDAAARKSSLLYRTFVPAPR